MSDELDKMYQSFLNNKVPENWSEIAYPSLKPLSSWIENLKERITFFKTWLLNGKPKAYWMPSFFFPQGFLTSLLQQYARKHKIAIDELSFKFDFTDSYSYEEIQTASIDGAYVYGFYFQCGRIDKDSLMLEDELPAQKVSMPPVIHFNPV